MANDYLIKRETLEAIGNEVRVLTEKTSTMTPAEMATNINTENTNFNTNLYVQEVYIDAIQTALAGKASGNGSDTADATATASDILSGKTAYAKGLKLTGTIPTRTSSNISVSGRTVTVPAGYYASQIQKNVGTAQAATTWTPTTSNQTIAAGTYCTGAQTILGDSNLLPGNIRNGKTIFGVTGTYTSDATAKASDISLGQTAYVNGEKILGTLAHGGITAIQSGTITNSSIVTTLSVQHNLGVVPNFIIVVANDSGTLDPSNYYSAGIVWYFEVMRPHNQLGTVSKSSSATVYASATNRLTASYGGSATGMSASNTHLQISTGGTHYFINREYMWIAGVSTILPQGV